MPSRRQQCCLALALCALLVGCTGGEGAGGDGGTSSDRDRERSGAAARLERLDPVPDLSRRRALTARLRFLGSVTPADGRATERRAAELEQLASRTLAQATQRRVRRILQPLPDRLRRRIGADVAAARELGALAAPQSELPDWRIVAPPRPQRLLGAYRRAERITGVGWEYLAAVHLVETRMGRIRGVSTAGAQGPMQFLPSTWEIYGGGGNIEDPEDAILAAARLLRANGGASDRGIGGALFRYNQSSAYVAAVRGYAGQMRRDPAAYRRYWHWRVIYRRVGGPVVLPRGYPRRDPLRLRRS